MSRRFLPVNGHAVDNRFLKSAHRQNLGAKRPKFHLNNGTRSSRAEYCWPVATIESLVDFDI